MEEKDVVSVDNYLARARGTAENAIMAWHKSGKGPGTQGWSKLSETAKTAYVALESAYEHATYPARLDQADRDPHGPGVTSAEAAEAPEKRDRIRQESADKTFAALQVASGLVQSDATLKTSPDYSKVRSALSGGLAGRDVFRDKVYAGMEASETAAIDTLVAGRKDKALRQKEAEGFIKSIVQGYSAVYDDPTAGAPLAPAGDRQPDVDMAKVRQEPKTAAEKAAVEQVHAAYQAAMKVQDAFQAGHVDEGLRHYVEARREAVKAYHALEKCPDYQPEARKAIGKALTALERDPKIGPLMAQGPDKGKDR